MTLPSQSSIFIQIQMQNMFNFVCNYFPGNELNTAPPKTLILSATTDRYLYWCETSMLNLLPATELTYGWCRDYASVPMPPTAQRHKTDNRRHQTTPLWWCMGATPHSWHTSVQSLKGFIKENIYSTSDLAHSRQNKKDRFYQYFGPLWLLPSNYTETTIHEHVQNLQTVMV